LNTALTDAELEHLLNFIGYGKLNADVWFLGMEEGGGGESNVRARLKFHSVEDCANAHRILGITKFHTGRKRIQSTWRGMSYIMLRLEGKSVDRESIRNYQADYLGRFQGNSLLCELMPLPKPRINVWGYETLIPQFKSSDEYYGVVKPRRVNFLRGLIQEYQPKIVIGYGQGPAKSFWQAYMELFPHLKFSEHGQFLVARNTDTMVVFTDHFTSKTMNGKFDEVVSIIKRARENQKAG
jgi:hypothetical protein